MPPIIAGQIHSPALRNSYSGYYLWFNFKYTIILSNEFRPFSFIFFTFISFVGISVQGIRFYTSYFLICLVFAIFSLDIAKYIEDSNKLFRRYKEKAKKDSLTGLNNVREFDVLYNLQLTRVREGNQRLSVLLIDIDHFKKVNDTYGIQLVIVY